MEKMEHIIWIPAYSVGNEVLDAQHQKLFDITNHVIDMYEGGFEDLLPAIKDLVDYVSVHFHAEHTFMMKMNYPRFAPHSREHERFTKKVEEFLKDYNENNPDLAFKMTFYLKDWVHNHTSTLDVQYGEYLMKHS